MSRIKGTYTCHGEIRTRWLDDRTGEVYLTQASEAPLTYPWVKAGDVWKLAGNTFTPDKPAPEVRDWYVLRVVPDEYKTLPAGRPPVYTAFGPYTEPEARENAALRSERSAGRDGRAACKPYAVVQVLAGNTVKVIPPTPPQPEVVWS